MGHVQLPPKPKRPQSIYLDYAAATPLDPKVFTAMKPFLTHEFGNPSALYSLGKKTKKAVEKSRETIANILHTTADTIIFTGTGSEANNMALIGFARTNKKNGTHIITNAIEHKSVLLPLQQLEKEGFKITYLTTDREGRVDINEIQKALRKDTILISFMYANNEIGTITPIADIGRMLLKWRKEHKTQFPYFHSDACQAAGALSLDVEKLHVDLMSIYASKIYGPKGVGVLYKRKNVALEPIIWGGGQEFGLRAGTENVANIVGMAEALTIAQKNREKENARILKLRNDLWNRIKVTIPDVKLNGPVLDDPTSRLPNNLNIHIKGIDSQTLLLYLDAYGIMCSTGSACDGNSIEGSYVLNACGLSEEASRSSVRFTLGKQTTKKNIEYVMKYLPGIVKVLRYAKTNL